MNRDREILFEVGDDALLVANGGRAFSREGVISICASHLSDKRSDDANDDVRDNFGGADEDLLQRIRERELATYCTDPNRITSDYRGEDETSRDYDGRIVWELLQNADDAMGRKRSSAELIGSKGLGFKAVLDVTEEPEVHSGPFHFRFSSADTQALLKKERLHKDPPPLTFRIPHCTAPCERVQELLEAGYATVIRLPFRDNEARDSVVKQLDDFNPLFLLLAPRLTRVRIRIREEETVHEITGSPDGLADGDVQLSKKEPNGSESVPWRRWTWSGSHECKHLSVAICLPLAEQRGADPVPWRESPPLFVFFPTKEHIGARALIHASFDLKQDRDHVRRGDHDEEIVGAFGALIQRVLTDVPARTVLKAFGEVDLDETPEPDETPESDETPLVGRLRQVVCDTLAASAFVPTVGGGLARPADVRFWKHRLGFVLREDAEEVADACLLAPGYRDLIDILECYYAEFLDSSRYIPLLRHCRNATLRECVLSWVTLTHVIIEQVGYGDPSQVPCWWTETETARSLADPTPLLLKRPGEWPSWLPAETLHPDMVPAVTWMERRRGRLPDVSKKLLRDRAGYLRYALVPHVSRWDECDWEEMGCKVLRQTQKWEPRIKDFDEIDPWVEEYTTTDRNALRASMVSRIWLPTDKGWLPAVDCYAGEVWGGLPAFDSFFASVANRGIVLPLDKWPMQVQDGLTEDDWKPLLRWLGVSWEPKVRAVRSASFPRGDQSQSQMLSTYLAFPCTWWYYNCQIEHFPQCMDGSDRRRSADAMDAGIRLTTPLKSRGARGHYRYYKDKFCENYAQHQLRHSEWLPCKPGLLLSSPRVEPTQAFMPGKGLGGLFPEVRRTGIDNERWYGTVQPFLRQLGVREKPSTDADEWHPWMAQLARLSEVECETDKLKDISEALYRGYLELDDSGSVPSSLSIPCFGLVDGREALLFASASEVCYVDEPHLEEVMSDIIQSDEFKLFVLSLNSGKDAPERLGIDWLSNQLEARAVPGHEVEGISDEMRRRYRKRWEGLGLAAGLGSELPSELAIRAVEELRLELRSDMGVIAVVDVLSWMDDADSPVLVNLSKNRWRALGHGLAVRVARMDDKAALFEALLRECCDEEYLDRLRYEGITEQDIERLGRELASSANDQEDLPEAQAPDHPEEEGRGERSTEALPALQGPSGDVRFPRTDSPSRQPERAGSASAGASGDGSAPPGPSSPYPRQGSRPPRTSAGSGQPDAAAGRAAEDWLGARLEESSSDRGYTVDPRVRDSQNRESDFVVRGDTDLHIEVKHLAGVPGKVYWSSGQCSKACDMLDGEGEEYVMALLVSDGEGQYRVYWIWRPVDQLVGTRREVQWEGRSGYEQVGANGWNVEAEQPDQVPVKRHIFRIHVDHELLSGLVEDDESLDKLWSRVGRWSA